MSLGIYLHIPFCKQRCTYCDFVSSTHLRYKSEVIEAMIKEIAQVPLSTPSKITIYFGGGTPSVLDITEIEKLLLAIKNKFTVTAVETTIEVNPDDVTLDYLLALRHLGIDRISIGIQSFSDQDLLFLNRRHSAQQAKQAVWTAHRAGFDNITVDLMYGLPQRQWQDFQENLQILSDLPVTHFSAYHLSVEKNTPLYQQYHRQEITLPTEEESAQQFYALQQFAQQHGFIHYETSNFGKPHYFAIHNTNYWKNLPYLGIGVGAHGYDGVNHRFENPTDISQYINMVTQQEYHYRTVETLLPKEQFNELLLIGLRTIFGVNVQTLLSLLSSAESQTFRLQLHRAIQHQHVTLQDNILTIPSQHWFIADSIIRDLMYDRY